MLVDAGPLIAIIDDRDDDHIRCVDALRGIAGTLRTTWPVLTEAMHLSWRRGDWPAQQRLWQLVERHQIDMVATNDDTIRNVAELMQRYRDAPMDLADATLVEAAELTGDRIILTLDSHFHAYRLSRNRRFTVLPA